MKQIWLHFLPPHLHIRHQRLGYATRGSTTPGAWVRHQGHGYDTRGMGTTPEAKLQPEAIGFGVAN